VIVGYSEASGSRRNLEATVCYERVAKHLRLRLRPVGDDLEEFFGTGWPESQLHRGQFVLDELQVQSDIRHPKSELEESKQRQRTDADEGMPGDLLSCPTGHRLSNAAIGSFISENRRSTSFRLA
jgi:hypothetical protein